METLKTNTVKTKWVLDQAHSQLNFSVKHLMISNVKGEFKNFMGEIGNEEFNNSSVKATIDAGSIFTNNPDRDNHLKSPDFFDVENHPEIIFQSNSFVKSEDDRYIMKGILNIKGVSREIAIDVEYGGTIKDPWGNEKAGFSFGGKINRKDWGLNWNAALETGGVMVSEEVKLSGEVQFLKQNN